jgi:hypothetical protein
VPVILKLPLKLGRKPYNWRRPQMDWARAVRIRKLIMKEGNLNEKMKE